MWGARPEFNISGKLSYQRIEQLTKEDYPKREQGRGYGERNISGTRSENYAIRMDHKHHPVTGKITSVACLRMYSTDILQFFPDGAVKISDYDTGITREVINKFGPLHIFKSSQHLAQTKQRFGLYGGENWPMRSDIVIRKDGTVRDLYDIYRRVIPSKKKQRRTIGTEFRAAATSRMVLGEFGDTFAVRGGDGTWAARIPVSGLDRDRLFHHLLIGADHADIMHQMGRLETLAPQVFGRTRAQRTTRHSTVEQATLAARDALLRYHLSDRYGSEYHEDYVVKYKKVQAI